MRWREVKAANLGRQDTQSRPRKTKIPLPLFCLFGLPKTQLTNSRHSLRKIMQLRQSTKNWKQGDTRTLLQKGNVVNHRSKEEVAASKAAAKSRKEVKEQRRREREEREAKGIDAVSAIEDALVEEDEEEETAFPRYLKGRSNP
jgi:hypothetical protein